MTELNVEVERLREALIEYADHQSWRCAHPDRFPWDPDCYCGLIATLKALGVDDQPWRDVVGRTYSS